MCGIAGVINSKLGRDELDRVLARLQAQLHHRGPDDHGCYVSGDGMAGLVSTRLAILDLSAAGHQPMSSADGRFQIAFNGEIYNYRALRADLEAAGERFSSHSDTEVILKMFARDGPDCVREFEGMFAFAIWDDREKRCFLARGPLGIKPLYYYEARGQLSFGSELRTVLESGLVPRRLSSAAAAGYLLFGAVPEPLTLVEDVRALGAGNYLVWQNGGSSRITNYWDVQFGDDPIISGEAVATTRDALSESVGRHLVSDVPVGVFLSGGIDSTAVVALASRHGGSELRTFSISFDDPDFNEGDVAAKTAQHFGTRHTDWRLDSATAKALLGEFLAHSDQPSIDGFNTFCVAKLAHDEGLKVVLSGLGGDELFGGYRSFSLVPRMVRGSRSLNLVWGLRSGVGRLMQSARFSSRTNRLGCFLGEAPSIAAAYWCMRGIFNPREVALLLDRYGVSQPEGAGSLDFYVPSQPTLEDEVSYLELTRYMRNQLLRDGDVMSMAWGLELRVPFVDRKLIERVERIPSALRLAKGKQMLLDAVPEIPEWVRNRRKQGFVFPFKDWVTGEWQDVFRRIEAASPIGLKSWYRAWCLFALESFLQNNRIECGPSLSIENAHERSAAGTVGSH